MARDLAYDVLVVGGGSAGLAAAVSAVRAGAKVALIERGGFLGGMATQALVGTICGLYLCDAGEDFCWAQGGFPREFAERLMAKSQTAPLRHRERLKFLPYDPIAFRLAADDLIAELPVDVFFHATLHRVDKAGENPDSAQVFVWNENRRFAFKSIVDCSGEASACCLAQARTVEPENPQAGALVFALGGIVCEREEVLRLQVFKEIRRGIEDGFLPPECERISLIPGSVQNHQALFKLGLPERDALSQLEMKSRRLVWEIFTYLRTHVEDLAPIALQQMASGVGVRTGRRALGVAVLTDEDVISSRKFPDAVAQGAWPIEIWGDAINPTLQFFEGSYDIPAGALRSADFENIYFAGRNLSATEGAIASARVIGTCLATGAAAGKMAALHAQGRDHDKAIQEIRNENVLTS